MANRNGNIVHAGQPAAESSISGSRIADYATHQADRAQSIERSPVLVELSGLSKEYVEAGQRRLILDHLDRSFHIGEFVCLLGKSGSGKSTLLNLISGIDDPSNGQVIFHDAESQTVLTALSEQKRTLFRREHIGIVFQFFNLIPTLTVLENVTLPMELAGAQPGMRDKAIDLLERVGLQDRLSTYPDKLSGGEQQRVAIARALIHDPLLVLADEPTGNLDEETGESVLDLLLELTRGAGKTLLMATHASEVANRADRVLHLVHGKLVRDQVWRSTHPDYLGND
jgi:putative ABC transport system ATP-binding protein